MFSPSSSSTSRPHPHTHILLTHVPTLPTPPTILPTANMTSPTPTPTPSISFQNTPSTGLAGEIFSIPLPSAIHSTLLSELLEDFFSLSPTSPSSSYIPPNVIIP